MLGSSIEPPATSLRSPLLKLTVKLIDTYVGINKLYYAQKKRSAENLRNSPSKRTRMFNDGFDDHDHNYIIQIGEIWDSRYRVLRVLGRGSFGQVVEALDLIDQQLYAVKIIKNRKAFFQQARVEITIVQYLNACDVNDSHNIVRFKRFFEHKNHLCLVYELLSFNLYQMLRNGNFTGISLNLVRKFAAQLLIALRFLIANESKIIHCDLKPENLLLRRPRGHALKVIDFGSSCYSTQRVYTYIQSRFYRSPEVIFGHQYGNAIDMWSLGCILVELLIGHPLFNGGNEHEQLCKYFELLGRPSDEFLRSASQEKISRFFLLDPATSKYSLQIAPGFIPRQDGTDLTEIIMGKCPHDAGNSQKQNYQTFVDFISKILVYDPAKRLAPADALQHPFLYRSRSTNTPTHYTMDNLNSSTDFIGSLCVKMRKL